MIPLHLLEQVPLLQSINKPALREIASRGVLRRFKAGDVIWFAGSEPRGLCFVLSGEVRAVHEVDGRQRVLHVERSGGTLGEVPLFSGGRYPATTIVTTDSECVVLDRDAILAAIRQDPALALVFLDRLARRVRHLVERLDRLTSHSVPARLAALLMERWRLSGGKPITLGRTQLEASEEIGTVREVLVRTLQRFRSKGLIAPAGRGRYRITNERGLEAVARERPS